MSEAATKPDIVVGVDGSDESFAALKWALEEASLTGQSVNAVFGWTHVLGYGGPNRTATRLAKVRHDIANELRVWVDKAAAQHRLRSGESEAHLGEGLRYFGPAADRP